MMSDLGLGIIVSLKDAFTRNAGHIQSSMDSLDASVEKASANMTRNVGLIEKGTMMIGAGLALLAIPTGLVASTAATQKALGELASVGVKDFRAMEDAAESFTNKWAGTQKAEFITAAYDVKSALANLSDEAVGTFASMAAITAKATKATTEEMVGTFTTAYGIFKPIMRDMSDMDWAKTFSGALAQTVASFKTTGPQMAEAIKNIGAIAAASNVPLQEQMAILGQLQTTMPGSEAGTLYKAFMMKATEAGDELGLSFVDAGGRLKGIIPILEEVKRKFPDLSQAAVQVQLKKAFGSDEAVRFLLQMSMGMDQLEGNINAVEQAMKQDIGSQYGLVKQQLHNLFEILGRTLLPVIVPVIQGVSRFILYLQGLARSAPGATRVILTLCAALGAILVVIGSVISTLGMLGILLPAAKVGIAALGGTLSAVGSAIAASFWPVVLVIGAVVLAIFLLRRAWQTNFAGIRDIVIGAWNKVSLAFQGIRALIGSLRGGTGQMSADLAKKLEAAGLMKFVTTVFQVYYRVREFLTGLWQAFSSVFGRIRAILEPAVRMLMGALGGLGKAIGSILAAFGLATTATDASSWKSIGRTLGTILGIIAEVGVYVIKFIVYPLSWAIRIVAAVVKAAVWLGKAIVNVFTTAGPIVYKFYLPLRMIVQGLVMVGRVAYTVWRMITGGISVVDGLKAIGGAVFDYLATPFRWVRDVASATWGFIRGVFMAIGGFFRSAANSVLSALANLPIVSTLSRVFATVRAFLSGRIDFTEAGKRILITLGQGIWSMVTYPYRLLRRALGWLRRLLPFSDAQEGPLSTLARSGAAILRTLGQGMLSVITLPGRILSAVLRQMLRAIGWIWDKLKSIGSRIVSFFSDAFSTAGSLVSSAWDGVKGAASSAWDGIASIGSSAWSVASAPFDWVADKAGGAWNFIAGGASSLWSRIVGTSESASPSVGSSFNWIAAIAGMAWGQIGGCVSSVWSRILSMSGSAIGWLRGPFNTLVGFASSAWGAVKNAASRAWSSILSGASNTISAAFRSGRSIMTTIADGIRSAVRAPYEAVKSAMARLRRLLPFSDAKEGPLSTLVRSGAAMLEAFSAGISRASRLPAAALRGSLGTARSLLDVGLPASALAATLALTPVVAGAVPNARSASPVRRNVEQSRLLAVTRGALASGPVTGDESARESVRDVLQAILVKLDELSDRPIEVSVTTKLDGRQIAQAVYKDMRERKVRNYESA